MKFNDALRYKLCSRPPSAVKLFEDPLRSVFLDYISIEVSFFMGPLAALPFKVACLVNFSPLESVVSPAFVSGLTWSLSLISFSAAAK